MSTAILPRTKHDALARYVFGRPKATAIVLRHVLPPPLLGALDLDTLRRLSAATARPSFGERDSDLLFDVGLRGRHAPPVRVALDHQSTPDALLPWRSFVYTGEQWGSHVKDQSRAPHKLPFVIPVLLLQPPALRTPTRLSDILDLPADLRPMFGCPIELTHYVDDLSASVLHDPIADPGHLALVEVTRILLYGYKNEDALADERLLTLRPLFDTILERFGPAEVTELLAYVVAAYGAHSRLHAIIMQTFAQETKEMFMTIADDLLAKGEAKGLAKGEAKGLAKGLAKGEAKGRAAAKAEAVLGVLERRALAIPRALHDRVLATSDESILQRWFDRAFTATTAEEVFEGSAPRTEPVPS